MADATADKATSGAQPRGLHEGAITVRAKYIADHSHSATDVIQCVKIPRDAIIDEIALLPPVGEASAPAGVEFLIGDGSDPNRYWSGSFSSTTTVRATSGLGFKYDSSVISDAAAVLYDTIDVTVNAGVLTASQGLYLTVTYHNDE